MLLIFTKNLYSCAGKWLKINGEAIYKTKPWVLQNDTIQEDVWYTQGQNGDVFATLLSWPINNTVHLSNLVKTTEKTEISILNVQEPLIVSKCSLL